ncbi:MAG: alkaline phosphatase [Planctomycetota bacterium]|jgi:alkaline phosphatase
MRNKLLTILAVLLAVSGHDNVHGGDHLRELQQQAVETRKSDWGYWGADPGTYSTWTSHSNRLIPVYSFGSDLKSVSGENSVYCDPEALKKLYGRVPEETANPDANHFDQTDIYRLQKQAVAEGAKRVILFVFDGMDWQTAQAASIHKAQKVAYEAGRGTGLHFQDYDQVGTDFGWCVTSAWAKSASVDVNTQTVKRLGKPFGGYSTRIGGATPWAPPLDPQYPIGKSSPVAHAVTDSASSATSMTAGIKTFNGAIGVTHDGKRVETIAHQLQKEGWPIGVVSSVPISHATPAAAYAHNVSRGDYQDLSRDLVGLKTDHRDEALSGVDVLLGAGWGVDKSSDSGQGKNFVPGNRYLPKADREAIDHRNGGKYEVIERTFGINGGEALHAAAKRAIDGKRRLFGFFGVSQGHLPYQTADGNYNTTLSIKTSDYTKNDAAEDYSAADVAENPTLADMTTAALDVLASRSDSFWLMVESGDVDWANHSNNLDNSIGAVLSGDDAFRAATEWIEANGGWKDTVVLLTADHGHYLNLKKTDALIAK